MTNVHILGANHSVAKYLTSLSSSSLYLYTRNVAPNSSHLPYSDLPSNLRSSDCVICLIPINHAANLITSLFQDYSLPAVSFVFLSSTSILSKLDTHSLDALQYSFFALGERSLLSFFEPFAHCRYFVLRLPMLWGSKTDKNVHRLFSFAYRYGFLPLSSKSVGLRAPIHISQLGQALVSLCERAQSVPSGIYNLMGPHVLSYHDICSHIVRLCQAKRTCHLVFLPQSVLQALTFIVRTFHLSFLYGFMEKFNRQSTCLVYPGDSIFDFIPALPLTSFESLLYLEYSSS